MDPAEPRPPELAEPTASEQPTGWDGHAPRPRAGRELVPGAAARFMNYVLHPKVQARLSEYVSYGTPVSLAKPLLPQQLSDPAIDPPSSVKLSIVTVTGAKLRKWQAAYDEVVTG